MIDISKDITVAECDYEYKEPKKHMPKIKATDEDFNRAIKRINKSTSPMIMAGGCWNSTYRQAKIKSIGENIVKNTVYSPCSY